MSRRFFFIAALVIAGCSTSPGHIERITPLPSSSTKVADTIIAVSQSATPTQTMPPTELSRVSEATATPLSRDLTMGSAMSMAAATDTAIQLTPRNRISFSESPVPIRFDEFYDGYNMRTGLVLSDKLLSLDGQQITIQGYMAPPLKPELDYFVLTRVRLAFCPFCSTAGDWPDDIALVYLRTNTTAATEAPVRLTGQIEIGASVDQETGMVSLVRIYADTMEILN